MAGEEVGVELMLNDLNVQSGGVCVRGGGSVRVL